MTNYNVLSFIFSNVLILTFIYFPSLSFSTYIYILFFFFVWTFSYDCEMKYEILYCGEKLAKIEKVNRH